jgi:hypothetical protein
LSNFLAWLSSIFHMILSENSDGWCRRTLHRLCNLT